MSEKKERVRLVSPVGRLCFPAIFHKAKPMPGEDANKETQYEVTIVFDKEYLKKHPDELKRFNAIQAEINRVCVEKFKKPIKDIVWPKFNKPMRDGMEKEHLDGFGAGTLFIKCKTKRRPGVIDPSKNAIEESDDRIYAGCYIRVNMTPFAYDGKNGGKGVSAALNSVMFVRDGERLDGGSNPEEDFGEMEAVAAGDDDDLL